MWVNTVVDVGGYCGAVLWGGIVGGYEIRNVSVLIFIAISSRINRFYRKQKYKTQFRRATLNIFSENKKCKNLVFFCETSEEIRSSEHSSSLFHSH